MKQTLIDILGNFCPNNVYLQGTLSESEAYPESFVTFFVNETPEDDFFDNEPNTVNWYFSVIYYSSDPALVNSKPAQIRSALKQAGFIPQGRGNDVPSDRPSHTGWAMDFIYQQTL